MEVETDSLREGVRVWLSWYCSYVVRGVGLLGLWGWRFVAWYGDDDSVPRLSVRCCLLVSLAGQRVLVHALNICR